MNHQITEIQIIPVKPYNGLIAFVNCVVNESLFLSSIAIHKKLDSSGYRLTYPTKKVAGKNLNIYHPITKELSKAIEQAIFDKCGTLGL
jgi:DNA-binding cell septation regulator SpoVG